MLTAVAWYFADSGDAVAAAACVVAVLGSLMVSYTRARAEALGVECKVGIATRPVRVVMLSIGLVFAKGAGIVRLRAAGAGHLRYGGADGVHGRAARLARAARARMDACASAGQTVTRTAAYARSSEPRPRREEDFARMSTDNGAPATAPARTAHRARRRQGPRRDRRRRQLRQRLHPGRHLLQGRGPGRAGSGPDARRPRRLSRPRHRVRRRVRHRLGEGRQGPLRGDLVGPERHDQVRRRAAARRPRPARDDPRRARQVPEGEDHQGSGPDRRHRRNPPGDEGRRGRLLPAGRLRAGDQVVRRAGARGRRRLRQLPARVHRPRGLLGRALPRGRACRSSATTSSRRSAPPSSTASWRVCSTTAACAWSAPRSSTSAATWTSTTCSSASGWTSKKESKTNAVTSIMGHELPADDVHVGPSDYVPWLTDRKWAHIRLEGSVVRRRAAERRAQARGLGLAELGRDRDRRRADRASWRSTTAIAGQLDGPSSYLMKSPHTQRPDDEAREQTEEFIRKHARKPAGQRATELKAERSRSGVEAAPWRRSRLTASILRGGRREPLTIAQVSPHPWGVATRGERVRRPGLGRASPSADTGSWWRRPPSSRAARPRVAPR